MLRTFVRVALVAAVVMPLAACGKSAEPTAYTPPSLAPDPEEEAKAAREAAYRQHLDAGTRALAAGELDSAIASLKLAVGEKPRGAEAHLHLGRAYTAKKDDAVAVKAYTEAVLANPQSVEAFMERAAILERTGQLDEAVSDYRKVIAIDTDRQATARAYWLRGGIMDRQGNRSDYRFFREQAIKLEPSFQKQVSSGDVLVANRSEGTVTMRIDQFVNPDGTERKFPPDVRFTVHGDTTAYLTYKGQLLTARSVRFSIVNPAGSREFTATYRSGMTLEIPIHDDDVPK